MAHRRVKDIDYDEDEYDDYYSGEDEYAYEGGAAAEETDDMTAEDKEQMRLGTQKVREALGDDYTSVTDAAIQEALWHYYYDVGKSVTYLKSMAAPISTTLFCPDSSFADQSAPQQQQAQAKKQKQPSKFDQAATSAAQKPVDKTKGESCPSFHFSLLHIAERHHAAQDQDMDLNGAFALFPPSSQAHALTGQGTVPTTPWPQPSIKPADWFNNVPWFGLAPERAASIVTEHTRPPLCLLGGTGKPSKLAALAAARKKKEAEQKAAQSDKPAGTPSLLDRLGAKSSQLPLQPQPDQENIKPGEPQQSALRTFPIRKRKSPSPPPPVEERRPSPPEPTPAVISESVARPSQDIRAGPSIFASTMCGGSSRRRPSHQEAPRTSADILPAIYGQEANLANDNAFSGPSPDDVVMQAQAKGSTRS